MGIPDVLGGLKTSAVVDTFNILRKTHKDIVQTVKTFGTFDTFHFNESIFTERFLSFLHLSHILNYIAYISKSLHVSVL